MAPEKKTAVIQALIDLIDKEQAKKATTFSIATKIQKEIIEPLIDETVESWTEFGYGKRHKYKTH
jgi:hypothetical protein